MRLILASASPRRAELLTAAGYEFEVHPVDIDERVRPRESARDYVLRLAEEKSAKAISAFAVDPGVVVLGADTAVIIGEEILGKPRDAEDAARMLRRLSGRTHTVMTGVCLRNDSRKLVALAATAVTFERLNEEEIAWYVASGEGTDKAGGYAIQGLASRFIPAIEGSYSNVVGLPIALVEALIQRLSQPPANLASGE